jgi:hypothetical protein
MPSNATESRELPDFESGFRFDEATLEALDRARDLPPLTFQEYLDFVSSLWLPNEADDPPPFTEPFTL